MFWAFWAQSTTRDYIRAITKPTTTKPPFSDHMSNFFFPYGGIYCPIKNTRYKGTHDQLCYLLPTQLPHWLTFTWWGCSSLCFWHKPTKLAHSFSFCSCIIYFCLYGPFNCILFQKFSQQLSAFSLCSSGLISALLVLSIIYISYEGLLQPWHNPL